MCTYMYRTNFYETKITSLFGDGIAISKILCMHNLHQPFYNDCV
jgi:hypothetical protein